MTNAALNGFLTRTAACEGYDISDRSIGRYLKRAMLRRDEVFLSHFKLATLDEEVIEGTQVDLALIARLTDEGRVPTWYVSTEWLRRNFDQRGHRPATEAQESEQPTNQAQSRGATHTTDSNEEIITLLKKQVEALEVDKDKLEQEKKEMREDARETRKLMNQMQQLMAHMQTRLLPERTARPTGHEAAAASSTLVVESTDSEQEEPTTNPAQPARREQPQTATTRPKRSKPRPARKQSPNKVAKPDSIWARDILDFLPFRR